MSEERVLRNKASRTIFKYFFFKSIFFKYVQKNTLKNEFTVGWKKILLKIGSL